jgi:hypothetical protein
MTEAFGTAAGGTGRSDDPRLLEVQGYFGPTLRKPPGTPRRERPPRDRPRRGLVGGGTSASTMWMQCSHQFHTAVSSDSHIVEAECSYEGTDASDRGLSGVRWSSGPPGRYAVAPGPTARVDR